ncbi:MAG: hypothetical protein OXF73_07840 [Gammaproteobacteria bacterium]|nr:hypothetical protein [Gammaproteobacteria bacterium]
MAEKQHINTEPEPKTSLQEKKGALKTPWKISPVLLLDLGVGANVMVG